MPVKFRIALASLSVRGAAKMAAPAPTSRHGLGTRSVVVGKEVRDALATAGGADMLRRKGPVRALRRPRMCHRRRHVSQSLPRAGLPDTHAAPVRRCRRTRRHPSRWTRCACTSNYRICEKASGGNSVKSRFASGRPGWTRSCANSACRLTPRPCRHSPRRPATQSSARNGLASRPSRSRLCLRPRRPVRKRRPRHDFVWRR